MNVRTLWQVSLLILVLGVLPQSMIACGKSKTSLPPKPPINIAWGHPGEGPKDVWKDYEWVIMAKEHFEGLCK